MVKRRLTCGRQRDRGHHPSKQSVTSGVPRLFMNHFDISISMFLFVSLSGPFTIFYVSLTYNNNFFHTACTEFPANRVISFVRIRLWLQSVIIRTFSWLLERYSNTCITHKLKQGDNIIYEKFLLIL